MNRDPFYRELLGRLDEIHDGIAFEACAVSLLGTLYPDLVPLPGGSDAGMDGSLEEGKAFLIATTTPDVIGNVTASLQSHEKAGDGRRRVVVATSRCLTNPARSRVRRRVRAMGFHLIELHDQASIAERLYHDPRWCRELLDLTNTPPALAAVPRGRRAFRDIPMVGRARELEWLRTTRGDRLIVGQPGIGKTFLTSRLVDEGDALYAVQEGLEPLAEALRATRCGTVIVENAHSPEGHRTLDNLLLLRSQCGTEFDIVADCWPREMQQLMHALRLGQDSVRVLRPLDPRQTVEIINACGIKGPTLLLHGLVHQARGFPGRAALLCHFCRAGDVEDVWRGEVLTRMARDLERLVGRSPFDYLALFALGGDKGLPAAVVAQAAGTSLDQVREALVNLDAGGIVEEIADGRFPSSACYQVVPARLRPVLVRDTLFRSPRMPADLDGIESFRPVEYARSLLHARAVGADLDCEYLYRKVLATRNEHLWVDFIHAGPDLAKRFAIECPVWSSEIGLALLQVVPELALPMLLRRAIGDRRSTSGHTDHALRQIEDWIVAATPDSEHHVKRCMLLLEALESCGIEPSMNEVTVAALRLVMSPGFATTEQDPGEWDKYTFIRGVITEDAAQALAALWPRVRNLLGRVSITDWAPIWQMIRDWMHPGIGLTRPLRRAHQRIFDYAVGRMIRDLAPLAAHHPAVLRGLLDHAGPRRLAGLPVPDPESRILFPGWPRHATWKEDEERQRQDALELGRRWSTRDLNELAKHLFWLRAEVSLAGERQTSMVWTAIHGLAQAAQPCLPWVDAFVDAGLAESEVYPMLGQAARGNEPGWRERGRRCLGIPALQRTGASLLLQFEPVPAVDIDAVLAVGSTLADAVRDLCSFGNVSEHTIEKLLRAETGTLAAAAADGLWHRDKKGDIPAGLRSTWIRALVHHVEDEHLLEECVGGDADVAMAFLTDRLTAPRDRFRMEGDVFAAAARHLSDEQRVEFIRRLPDNDASREAVQFLVGDSIEMFRVLLRCNDLDDSIRLAPLCRGPDETWIGLAQVAFEAGMAPEAVVDEAFSLRDGYCGSLVDRARGMAARWDALRSHPDHRIRLAAAAGSLRAAAEVRSATRFESTRQGGWYSADGEDVS